MNEYKFSKKKKKKIILFNFLKSIYKINLNNYYFCQLKYEIIIKKLENINLQNYQFILKLQIYIKIIMEDKDKQYYISIQFPKSLMKRKKIVKEIVYSFKDVFKLKYHDPIEVHKVFHKEKQDIQILGFLGFTDKYKFPTQEMVKFSEEQMKIMQLVLMNNNSSDDEKSRKGSYIGTSLENEIDIIKESYAILQKKKEQEKDDDENEQQFKMYERKQSLTDIQDVDLHADTNINKLDNYIIQTIIDQGEYGTVYLGQQKNGDLVAIKAIEPEISNMFLDEDPHRYFNKEKLAYEIVGEHPHIVKYIGSKQRVNYTYENRSGLCDAIILEYLQNGNLENLIENSDNVSRVSYGLDEDSARIYFRQMLSGIKHIHDKGLCHRDIKLDNMVLDAQNELKIIDLTFLTNDKIITNKQRIGSNQYMAPEIGRCDDYYGQIADIYSLGVCLFRLVTGGFPCLFRAGMSDGLYVHIHDKDYKGFWDHIDKYRIDHGLTPLNKLSSSFKDLVTKMIAYDYNERLKMDDILNHEWMQYGDQSSSGKTPTSAKQYKTKFNKNKYNKTISDKKQSIAQQRQQIMPVFSPLFQIDLNKLQGQLKKIKENPDYYNQIKVQRQQNGPLYSMNKSH